MLFLPANTRQYAGDLYLETKTFSNLEFKPLNVKNVIRIYFMPSMFSFKVSFK